METENITLRIPRSLLERMDGALEALPPPVDRVRWTRSDIARAAIAKGLDQIEMEVGE